MRKNANPDAIDRLDPVHLQRTGAAVKRYIKVYERKTGRLMLIVGTEGAIGLRRPHGISFRDLEYAANHARSKFCFTENGYGTYFARASYA